MGRLERSARARGSNRRPALISQAGGRSTRTSSHRSSWDGFVPRTGQADVSRETSVSGRLSPSQDASRFRDLPILAARTSWSCICVSSTRLPATASRIPQVRRADPTAMQVSSPRELRLHLVSERTEPLSKGAAEDVECRLCHQNLLNRPALNSVHEHQMIAARVPVDVARHLGLLQPPRVARRCRSHIPRECRTSPGSKKDVHVQRRSLREAVHVTRRCPARGASRIM